MERLLNPGFSNQIFLMEDPIVSKGGARIANGKRYYFNDLTFDTSVIGDFIKVNIYLEYAEYGESGIPKASLVKVTTRYRLVKDHDFDVKDFEPIVNFVSLLLVDEVSRLPKDAQPEDHQLPDHLILRNVQSQLDKLADELNLKSNHLSYFIL